MATEALQLEVLTVSGAEVETLDLVQGTTVIDVKIRLGSDPDCTQLVQDGKVLCDDDPILSGQCVMVVRQVPLPALHVPVSTTPECLGQGFDVSDTFSISAFVKVSGRLGKQGGRILAKRVHEQGWEFAAPRWNGPVSFYSRASGHHNVGRSRVDDGSEHHVAVTYAEGRLKAYVDGCLDGERSFSVAPAPAAPLWTRARGGTEDPLIGGELRDIMAWHRQLSDEQIAAIYRDQRSPLA
mmetsp:Transcript_19532/g.34478  ORF Transcript_19532/g.34478 Transcript_19532/m.34478 type:complete len:239 (+) Transcript_19532:41-757(+)